MKAALGRYRAWLPQRDLGILHAAVMRCKSVFIPVALAICLPASVHAQSTNLHAVVALSSQLVDRGLAITPATPILQGAVSWTLPDDWSLGLSGGTEVRSPRRISETLAQASRHWRLSSDWQMQASMLYYHYFGNARSRVYDRGEMAIDWTYRDVLTFGLSAARVIGAGDHRPRAAADVNFNWPLGWQVSLSAGAGVAQALAVRPPDRYAHGRGGSYSYRRYAHLYDNGSPYRYGHAGLMWSDGTWRVELDRIVTDSGAQRLPGYPAAVPWVATISRSF
ncbi:MAG: hypothetical protein ABI858_03960 [Pseudoxanthomonas sp.]